MSYDPGRAEIRNAGARNLPPLPQTGREGIPSTTDAIVDEVSRVEEELSVLFGRLAPYSTGENNVPTEAQQHEACCSYHKLLLEILLRLQRVRDAINRQNASLAL